MNVSELSVAGIFLMLGGVVALFVLAKGFNLPRSFFEQQQKRAEMRKKILSAQLEAAQRKEIPEEPDQSEEPAEE